MKGGARFLSFLLFAVITLGLFGCTVKKTAEIFPVELPKERVKTLSELSLHPRALLPKVTEPSNHGGQKGLTHTGIFISPDYKLRLNGREVPVYATLSYVPQNGGKGVFQSFCYADIKADDLNNLGLEVEIESIGFGFKELKVFPLSSGVSAEGRGTEAKAYIDKLGQYTFVSSGSSTLSEDHSLLLFLREYKDEEKEISEYQKLYGKENVKVFEKGTHYLDYLSIEKPNTVLYFKRGSLLVAKHNYDLKSFEDEGLYADKGAEEAIGQKRYPVISAYEKDNVKILGRGVIDLSLLDWHERNGIEFSYGKGFTVEGLTLVNAPNWSFFTYIAEDVEIKDCVCFGYRTNSDGFAVCNTKRATVKNCFARSGDDLFEVKTLGSWLPDASAENILFEDCVAWGSKARCFGAIAETQKDMKNITFRNSSVIFSDALWNGEVLGSLCVIQTEGDGNVYGVTFENINIFYEAGSAINVSNLVKESKNKVENIVFKNITYSAKGSNRFVASGGGTSSVRLQNVIRNGEKITEENLPTFSYFEGAVDIICE